jgi:hypothetical protein
VVCIEKLPSREQQVSERLDVAAAASGFRIDEDWSPRSVRS